MKSILSAAGSLLVLFLMNDGRAQVVSVPDSEFIRDEREAEYTNTGPSIVRIPIPIKQVKPEIPDSLRGIHATVWVKALVGRRGNVWRAEVQKSDGAMFNEPAIAAARQWKFKPAIEYDQPVACWTSIPFRFGNPGDRQINAPPPNQEAKKIRRRPLNKFFR